MIKQSYQDGQARALRRFKLSSAAFNPTVSGQASAPAVSPPTLKPPVTPAAPVAAGAPRSKVLG